MEKIDDKALNQLFLQAHTHYSWQEKQISNELLKEIYDMAKMGPTSVNCQPMRIIFVKSSEAKARLKTHLAESNIEKTMGAPVTAIIGYDIEFYENLPQTFPHTDAKSWFVGNASFIHDTAFRNSSLQAAYFMLAARALGLDVGPMSGYNQEGLDKEFFPDNKIKSNFLCNLGYGDNKKTHPRNPRLEFAEVVKIV